MTMLLQRPINRDDIMSTLLDDYMAMGDDFERGDVSPLLYEPVPPPKDNLPFLPKAMEKPLPLPLSIMGPFQLRANKSNPSSPSSITSKFISRNTKPPSLKLTSSNGSTASLTTPPSIGSQPFETIDIDTAKKPSSQEPARGRSFERIGSERSPSDSPPPVPEKAIRRKAIATPSNTSAQFNMGNKASKPVTDRGGGDGRISPTASSQIKGSKTRPGTGRPTLADTMSRGLRKPRSEQKAHSSILSEISKAATNSTGPTVNETWSSASRENAPSVARTEDTMHTDQTVIHHKPETLAREPSLSGGSDSAGDDHSPQTPPKPLLPDLNPMGDALPSDYGLLEPQPSPTKTLRESTGSRQHSRGKSSSGLELFRQTSALQNASTYLNLLASSPHLSPLAESQFSKLHTSPSQPVLSQITNRHHQHSTTNTSQSTISQARPSTVPNLRSLNPSRPDMTLAPVLTSVHMNCFLGHAKFHPSRNTLAPVPCMLCYSEGTDERFTCTFCALRICKSCRGDLEKVKGRDLKTFIHLKESRKSDAKRGSNPGARSAGAVTIG